MVIATTLVGIITAVATVITACSLLIASINGFRKISRVEDKLDVQTVKIDDVHVLVNQQQTDLRNYIAELVAELVDKGIKVPRDQSKPTPPV